MVFARIKATPKREREKKPLEYFKRKWEKQNAANHRKRTEKRIVRFSPIPWNKYAAPPSRKHQVQAVLTRTQNLDFPARQNQHLRDIYCACLFRKQLLLPVSWNCMVGLINFCEFFLLQRKVSLLAKRSVRVQDYLLNIPSTPI